ncbi:MAG TPA: hypothetical protein PL157_19220, partial [Acidobacteriota bacterium]|nr:hypothetical protein [Acidobacteriota bacterium]
PVCPSNGLTGVPPGLQWQRDSSSSSWIAAPYTYWIQENEFAGEKCRKMRSITPFSSFVLPERQQY